MMSGAAPRPACWLALLCTLAMMSCVDGLPTEAMPGATEVPIQFPLENAANISADEETAINDAFNVLDQLRVRVTRPGASAPFIDTLTAVEPGQDSYEVEISVPVEENSVEVQVELIGSVGDIELFSAVVTVTIRGSSADTPVADSTASDSTATGPAETITAVVITLPIRYTGPGLRGLVLDPDGAPAQGELIDLFQGEDLVQSSTTGANGEYLFTNLEPIDYVVRARTGDGIVSCPSQRDIEPASELSRVVGGFKLSRSDCRLDVLVLSGGDVDNNGGVIGALSGAIPEAQFSSEFVVVGPPSLSLLLQYDAVLLYENGTYEHADQVGSRVAEYIGAGGNVIIRSFYWQNHSGGGFGHRGWGALEGLDVFSSTGGAVYRPGSLGSVTPHPITEGVTEITTDRWWGGVSANGGTTVVASWADGTPMAGFVTGSGGQRIVAISSFPGGGGRRSRDTLGKRRALGSGSGWPDAVCSPWRRVAQVVCCRSLLPFGRGHTLDVYQTSATHHQLLIRTPARPPGARTPVRRPLLRPAPS